MLCLLYFVLHHMILLIKKIYNTLKYHLIMIDILMELKLIFYVLKTLDK
jgi:hypothetical protein